MWQYRVIGEMLWARSDGCRVWVDGWGVWVDGGRGQKSEVRSVTLSAVETSECGEKPKCKFQAQREVELCFSGFGFRVGSGWVNGQRGREIQFTANNDQWSTQEQPKSIFYDLCSLVYSDSRPNPKPEIPNSSIQYAALQ